MDLNFWKKEFPKKVTKTCKVAGEKSSQLIEEAKLRLNIANLNDKIADKLRTQHCKYPEQHFGDIIIDVEQIVLVADRGDGGAGEGGEADHEPCSDRTEPAEIGSAALTDEKRSGEDGYQHHHSGDESVIDRVSGNGGNAVDPVPGSLADEEYHRQQNSSHGT